MRSVDAKQPTPKRQERECEMKKEIAQLLCVCTTEQLFCNV